MIDKNRLIGIMGLIVIIIPMLSLNIKQTLSTTEQETEITTEEYSCTLDGFHYLYSDLGYKYAYLDILEWQFSSTEKTIDVKLLTDTEFAKYENSQTYTYWELSSGLLSDFGSGVFPETDSFYLVFENNHLFSTYITIDHSFDKITAEISYLNIDYIDTDNDGYNDDFEINFKITPSHLLSFSFYAKYELQMRKLDGQLFDFEIEDALISNIGYTGSVNFADCLGEFKITLRTFYASRIYHSMDQDDIKNQTTSEIFAEGYADVLAHQELMGKLKFYGLFIGILAIVVATIIITVVVVVVKKRNVSLIKP